MTRANERIRQSTRNTLGNTVRGYSEFDIEQENIQLQNGETHYALYPAWLLNTSWNGKKYSFAMNGQSGKFVGNLPADKAKAVLFFLIGAVIAGVLAWFLSEDPMITAIAALAVGGIVFGILFSQLKTVVKQSAAAEYIKKDSFRLTHQQDLYLYKKTEKRPREQ